MKYCFSSAQSSNRFSADQCYFSHHLQFPQLIFHSQNCVYFQKSFEVSMMMFRVFFFLIVSRGQLCGKVAVLLACSLAFSHLCSHHLTLFFLTSLSFCSSKLRHKVSTMQLLSLPLTLLGEMGRRIRHLWVKIRTV